MGPGNIATAALLAPLAMATAARVGIPLFLMAIMVGNGANSGALSPFAPTGIIVNGIMATNGLPGLELQTYLYNLLAHALVAFSGYALFGGLKLFVAGPRGLPYRLPAQSRSKRRRKLSEPTRSIAATGSRCGDHRRPACERHRREGQHRHGRFCRRSGAGALEVGRRWRGDQADAMAGDRHGVRRDRADRPGRAGAGHRSAGLARRQDGIGEHGHRPGRAFTGLVSVYSSTSGVVLPAFLPMVPGLAAALPGASPIAIATSMNVGGHLVDVSPLSTIGALCLAGVAAADEHRALFNKLLAWGLSMAVVGAVLCFVLF